MNAKPEFSEDRMDTPKPGLYRHYKGGFYAVIGCARHSETSEILVVYWSYNHNGLFVRPRGMFLEEVDHLGDRIPRFLYHGPASVSLDLSRLYPGKKKQAPLDAKGEGEE